MVSVGSMRWVGILWACIICSVATGEVCYDNNGCGPGFYCQKDPGACDAAGVCAEIPAACDDVLNPVCGCDGQSYKNACEAALAGVSVAAAGLCEPHCDGFAGLPCPGPDQFCEKVAGTCNIADNLGTCVARPVGCWDVWEPVCGCDGQTYSNDCDRRMAMVSKDHDGPCGSCMENADCGGGRFCLKEHCDAAWGVCETRPLGCPDVWLPVCGCDGVTYGNECEAWAVGVNVAHEGSCEQVCGGIAGIVCEQSNQFCEFAPGTCEIIDNQGLCAEVPEVCPDVWEPVCGCDGKTYANDCDRRAAMVSKDHDGPCGGCAENADCGEGRFCYKGHCDALEGVCETRPEACPEIYAPVCGCDGVTYGNECEAWAAGVNIAHEGFCPQVCGGIAGIMCEQRDQFCEFAPGTCEIVDNQGLCVERSQYCPLVYEPVCGCDGITYGNDCMRRKAAVSKAHDGPCCFEAIWCGAGFVAVDTDGDGCEDTCKKACERYCDCLRLEFSEPCPLMCPMCGNYWTCEEGVCEEQCGMMPYDYYSACEEDLCWINDHCGADQYCSKEEGACGGLGFCQMRPEVCPAVVDPVCGCDGNTYGNACEAAAGGVNVAWPGLCERPFCAHRPRADVSGDCRVSIEDLALLAAGWLDCGLLGGPAYCY